MIRRVALGLLVFAFAWEIVPMSSQAADVISNISISWNTGFIFNPPAQEAFVFQTGPSVVSLNSISLNLLAGQAAISQSVNFSISLYEVDGSNNPTGTALSTDPTSATWANPVGGGNYQSQIFTFANLTNLFALNLAASKKYALVMKNGVPNDQLYWATANTSNYTTSAGFSFTTFRSSSDNGSTWSTPSNHFPIISISAVPEPSTCALAGISALVIGCFGRRRTRS